jgi:hypothetical protein
MLAIQPPIASRVAAELGQMPECRFVELRYAH